MGTRQIDWAHVGSLRVQGGVRPLYCFVLLLRHSRAMWAELVLEQTTTSLIRSLVRAAQYFGGVTREWLFDNPKSIVAARQGSAIRFQSALVDIASHLHVALRACRVRTHVCLEGRLRMGERPGFAARGAWGPPSAAARRQVAGA